MESVNITTPGGDAAATPAADPVATPSYGGGMKAESASAILGRIGMSASTTPEASEYNKTLARDLREALSALSGKDIGEVKILPVPCEHACIHRISIEDHHVLMAFSDTYQPPVDTPFVAPSKYLAECARELYKAGIHVETTVTITPDSYPLVGKMVKFMTSTFLVMMMPEKFQISLDSLKQDRYVVRTRLADVRRIIEDSHPTATLPPVDVGLAIFTNPQNRDETPKLLMAIGGTTDFVSTTPTGVGTAGVPHAAVPVTTITAIVAPAPSLSIAILGITLAADAFMRRQLWLEQFTNFSKDVPNIGNLIMDSEGKPFHVGDMMTLHEFHNTRLQKPALLAIDIADGAPRIPGLEKICANAVQEDVANFLGRPVDELQCGISAGTHMQYHGAFGDGTDTRKATYLHLCTENPAGISGYIPFLVRNTNPEFTMKALAELFNNTQLTPLYSINRTILNAPFLNLMTTLVSDYLDITWETDSSAINNVGALPTGDVAAFGPTAMYGGAYGAAGGGYHQMVYGG